MNGMAELLHFLLTKNFPGKPVDISRLPAYSKTITIKQMLNCLSLTNNEFRLRCPFGQPADYKQFRKGLLTMKKTYRIDVDCANCANKMEDAAKRTAGVKDATVNFMTLKMIVEFEDGQDPKSVMQDVLKNCKKVESDCEIFL